MLEALGNGRPLPGMSPVATVYSGHQFGVWAGQLGDGRALLQKVNNAAKARIAARTGLAAERLGRRWIATEWILQYARGAAELFRQFDGFQMHPAMQWATQPKR